MLWSALEQLGSKIGEVTNHLFGATSAAEGNGDAWTALGNVIGFTVGLIVSAIGVLVSVISAAVAIVSVAIEIVMSVFSRAADVITGVVFIIGGIINGSWTDIWTGMNLVAFVVADAIIGAVLELAGAIAGVIDALSGLFGEGTQWQQGIRDFRSSLRTDMVDGMGVQDLSFTRPTRQGTTVAESTFGTITAEPFADGAIPADLRDGARALFPDLDGSYSRARPASSLGYETPAEDELEALRSEHAASPTCPRSRGKPTSAP